jgi:hypothetical protein
MGLAAGTDSWYMAAYRRKWQMGLTSRIAAETDSWDWQLGFASGMALGTGSWDRQLKLVVGAGN